MNGRFNNARILVDALRDPASVDTLDADGWTALLTMARAEQLIGTLAHRVSGQDMPPAVSTILQDANFNAKYQRETALWEADRARAALAEYDRPIVLMKGTAYHAADLLASKGRHVGDLDIMVAEDDLPQVEKALIDAGWEWVKEDAYDDAYYRDYMHELPPLIHKERDRMADVHHTILPKTARQKPNAAAMLDTAIKLEQGDYIFSPADMLLHNVAHLLADGDLTGGLRNLWDFHCLVTEFAKQDNEFWQQAEKRANLHGLKPHLKRALRLSRYLFGTGSFGHRPGHMRISDYCYIRRLLARDEYGRLTRKFTRMLFYIRSHLLRMPPLMLARHLWTKWRKGYKPVN